MKGVTMSILNKTFSISLLSILMILLGCQWDGPNNTHDTIHRTGAVGIGKLPNSGIQLHVFKVDSGDAMAQIQSDVEGGNAWLRFNRGGATPWDIGYNNTDFQFVFRSGPKIDAMILKSNGNVGIGTTTPGDKLEVAGNIRVSGGGFIDDGTTLTVPDFVFEDNYPLMPMDELRTFIENEKHLPGLANAREIVEKGLNLSDHQMKLLQKVEELTLYVLKQDEQIKIQQKEILTLKKKLAYLQ